MKKKLTDVMPEISDLEIEPIDDEFLLSIQGGCGPQCSVTDCSSNGPHPELDA